MTGVRSLVSVIIPTYNRAHLVTGAIESVLAQTFTDYEIIVVDDGSTDATGEVLSQRYGDRIRYLYQANAGRSVTRNRGVDLAKGEYVAFLDSDDLWLPQKLERMVAFMEAGGFGVAGHKHDLLRNGTVLRNPQEYERPSSDGALPVPRKALVCGRAFSLPTTTMCTRRLFAQSQGFRPSLWAYEDMEWVWRACVLGRVGFLPECLALVRVHQGRTPLASARAAAQRIGILEDMLGDAGEDPELRGAIRRSLAWTFLCYASALRSEQGFGVGCREAVRAVRAWPSVRSFARLALFLCGRDFRRLPFWRRPMRFEPVPDGDAVLDRVFGGSKLQAEDMSVGREPQSSASCSTTVGP